MIIDPHQVPDEVMAAYWGLPRGHPHDDNSVPLAAALTEWERFHRPEGELQPLTGGHECKWRVLGVKSFKIIGIAQTQVLQRCAECSELKTAQLQGEWTLKEVTEGRPA